MKLFSFVLLFVLITPTAHASSGVYNGGDTVDAFLEATRTSPLLNTISDIANDKRRNTLPPLCNINDLAFLSETEKQFCHQFILDSIDALRNMNSGLTPVEFKIQTEPLLVPDKDGVLRPVKAATLLDSTSPILFHYDSIKNMVPKDLLALLIHEFGHKVTTSANSHVSDNDPIGPFANGRRLLDSIGIAFSSYAVSKNRVGEVYGLADYFSCKIYQGDYMHPSMPVSLRYFPQKGNYDSFESGVGIFPTDLSQCYIENLKRERIALNFRIHEEFGCAQNQDESRRYTYAELMWYPAPGSHEQPKRLTAGLNANWNPLCLQKPSEAPVELSTMVNGQTIRFEIRYERSMGTTIPLSFRSAKRIR